jgi:hypothetical protein
MIQAPTHQTKPHQALGEFDRSLVAVQMAYASVVQNGSLEDVIGLCERIESMTKKIGAMMDGVDARLRVENSDNLQFRPRSDVHRSAIRASSPAVLPGGGEAR